MTALNNIETVSIPSLGKIPLADDPGTFTPSAVEREHKPGRLHEDGGYLEKPTPAKLELSINLKTGLDIDALNAVANETITVRLHSGAVYMMAQAWIEEPAQVGQGETKATFVSNVSERIG